MKITRLFAGAAAALGCSFAFSAPMDSVPAAQVFAQGKFSDYLAGDHMRTKGLQCSTCHPTDKVTDSQNEIDASCIKCHGTYQQLGAKDKEQGKGISPHAGHLSINSCTTCHGGHIASFAYCNNCHIFDMPMKFGRQKIPYVPHCCPKHFVLRLIFS